IQALGLDQEIPKWLKFFPAPGISEMFEDMFQVIMRKAGFHYITPGIEGPIGPVITFFQFGGAQPYCLVYDLARIVLIPIPVQYPALRRHIAEQAGAGIRSE